MNKKNTQINMKRIKSILKNRIKYLSILMSGIFILLFGVSIRAQDSDGNSREVWSGTVIVNEHKTIYQGETLIIEPGTEVDFQTFSLTIYGTLIAEGTPVDTIILETSNKDTGWKGIKFETTVTKSVLKHCKISGIIPNDRSKNKSPENVSRNAILIKQAIDTVLIDQCKFFDNKAGIFITNDSKDVIITNSQFQNNTVADEDIEGIVFIDQNSICQLVGNEFINDTVNRYGVVGMRGGSYAFILNNTFKNTGFIEEELNYPFLPVVYSYYGGNMAYNTCWFMGNVFENNFKQDIYFIRNTFAFLIKNIFIGDQNINTKNSALYAKKSYVKIDSCSFEGYDGSAIVLTNSDALIEHNKFNGNNAIIENGNNGGAIRLKGTSQETTHHLIEILYNNFTGNSAFNGGVIYLNIKNDFCDILIKHNKFFNNSSQANGGAMRVVNSNLTASKNLFYNNTANGSGGAVSCLDTVFKGFEDKSYYFKFNDNEFYLNNSGIKGGALDCISDDTDTPSHPAELSLHGNKFYHNKTFNENMGSGGAIAVKQCLVQMDSNMVFYNKSFNGGGLFLETLFESEITDNYLYENSAANNGGGLYLVDFILDDDSIKIHDNVISRSHYGYKGGGIFIDTCFNTSFLRNRIDYGIAPLQPNEDTYGGGVFINFSSLDFYNNIFSNNATVGQNGCIYINSITEENKINFINCNVFGNAEAGGVYIDSDTINSISFINTMFWGNGDGLTFITPIAQDYVASAEFCWFVDGYGNLYIDTLEPTIGISPGVVNISVDYNLQLNSSCIDNGNPDTPYNDLFFPPSRGSDRNDIGATGGPYTANDSSSKLLLVKTPVPIDVVFTATPNPFIHNGYVRIRDYSTIYSPSDDDEYHWYFGNGNDSVYKASEHEDFTYKYADEITQAEITLMIKAGNNIEYLTVMVNLGNSESEKQISKNPAFKLLIPELNENINEAAEDPNGQIVVFPNPSSGVINIAHNLQTANQVDIQIYNTSGVIVLSRIFDSSHSNTISLDLTGILPGIYFIEVKCLDSKFSKKILITQ